MIFDTFDFRESPIARRLPVISSGAEWSSENAKFVPLTLWKIAQADAGINRLPPRMVAGTHFLGIFKSIASGAAL